MGEKINHLKPGAKCSWVPSPTAASLHALHYHQINIFDEQKKILNRKQAQLDDLLTIPIADRPNWSVDEINSEISNLLKHYWDMLLDGLIKELVVQKSLILTTLDLWRIEPH